MIAPSHRTPLLTNVSSPNAGTLYGSLTQKVVIT